MAEIWSAYREGRIVADVVIKPDGTYRLLPRDPHFLTKSYKTKQAALKALSQYGDVPTEYETVTPEGIKEFEILNMRGQRFGNRTFGTIEEANRFLEKKITAPPARLQFLIQEVKLGVAIPKAAPEIPDPDKDLYFGEKEKLALSMIGSVAEVPKVGVEGGVIKPIRYQKTPVDEAIFKVIDVGRPETRNTLFHTINNQPLRAQEIYTYTQQTLKAKYPTGKVTLYRFPRAIEEQKIASWSTSPKFFTKEMQPSLISKEFDITDIFAHPDTYPLLKERGEGEVLVMLQKPSSLTIPQVPKAVPKHIDEAIWNAMPGYRQAEVAKAARQVPRSGKLYWRELTQSERDAISQIEEHYAT